MITQSEAEIMQSMEEASQRQREQSLLLLEEQRRQERESTIRAERQEQERLAWMRHQHRLTAGRHWTGGGETSTTSSRKRKDETDVTMESLIAGHKTRRSQLHSFSRDEASGYAVSSDESSAQMSTGSAGFSIQPPASLKPAQEVRPIQVPSHEKMIAESQTEFRAHSTTGEQQMAVDRRKYLTQSQNWEQKVERHAETTSQSAEAQGSESHRQQQEQQMMSRQKFSQEESDREVRSQRSWHRTYASRKIRESEESKENQEMIFLKHRVPRYHMEEDTRPHETVRLRHVVPYSPIPEQAQPPEKQSPPRSTFVSKSLTVLDGHVARFECKYEPVSDPYLRIEWYHNKRPLVHGSRLQTFCGSGTVYLNITSCIKEDSGSYVCMITNKLGTDSAEINLNVIERSELAMEQLNEEEKQELFRILEDSSRFYRETVVEEKATRIPRFVKPFRRVRVNEGETAYFETRIEPADDPTMRVSWFHNSKELQVGSRWQHLHDFGFVSMHIRHCVDDDGGHYVCRIQNSEGFAETSVPLQVIESSDLSLQPINPESAKQITSLEDDSRRRVMMKEREMIRQPPKFVTKFRSQSIREREKAHFEARFEPIDDGSLKIDWFHNGTELPVGSRWQVTKKSIACQIKSVTGFFLDNYSTSLTSGSCVSTS
jgi:hypothetical protein